MAMETTMTMAVAMGRTLVLPPAQQMYLLGKPKSEHTGKEQRKEFSFADFFHMESIADEHVGMEVITMKEFLEREALTGNLRDQKTGEVVFPPNNRTDYDGADHRAIANVLEKYLQRVGMVPPWDPDNCLAAFPATSDPKDVQALRDMVVGIEDFPNFVPFIDKPVPINGSTIDRFKENRADRTQLCIYDEKWQNVQLIHFGEGAKGEEGARLLVHFYAFLFFQDWKHDTWMKRFVRDHVRYIDEIQVRCLDV
jgi:GDP-fucose protein O-fucosyltransferase